MGWLLYLTISIILMSLNVYIVKTILKKVNPYVIIFYQYLIGLILVYIYSFFINSLDLNQYFLSLMGVIYVAGIILFYTALKKGNLSKVSTVFNMKLIITALLSIFLLNETAKTINIIGLFLGGLSVYLLSGDKK